MKEAQQGTWNSQSLWELHELTEARLDYLRSSNLQKTELSSLKDLLQMSTQKPTIAIPENILRHPSYVQMANDSHFIEMKNSLDREIAKQTNKKKTRLGGAPSKTHDPLIELEFINQIAFIAFAVLRSKTEERKAIAINWTDQKAQMRKNSECLLESLSVSGHRVLDYSSRKQLQDLLATLLNKLSEKQEREYKNSTSAIRSILESLGVSLLSDSISKRTMTSMLHEFSMMLNLMDDSIAAQRKIQRYAIAAERRYKDIVRKRNVSMIVNAMMKKGV